MKTTANVNPVPRAGTAAWRIVAAFAGGLGFGFGLWLSGMTDPRKVQGFLDLAGRWDPTLLFVLGGAVGVALVGFAAVLQRQRPLLDDRFHLPTKADIDAPLLIGAAIFGVGWALAGYCPGPAIASLAIGSPEPWIFVAAMAAGSFIADRLP